MTRESVSSFFGKEEFEREKIWIKNGEKEVEKVWGYEYYGDIRTVDVTVRRIREKIETDTSAPKILITKRGVGYYIAAE